MSSAAAEAVGFALAGGRSRRMQRDKALLRWRGSDLLDHTLARLREVTSEVRILSGPRPRYLERGLPVEIDRIEDGGPLAGVLAGLEAAAGRAGLFLAVDLPLVPVPLLARLLELAHDVDAVVPDLPHGPEPLCAVYGPGCLEPIREQVAGGDLKMTSFWPTVRVRRLSPAEVSAFGDPERLFLNLNQPADYHSASAAQAR